MPIEKTAKKRSALSPAKLALLEQRLRGKTRNEAAQTIPRRQQQNFLPLSFAQQRLWFLDQLEPASSAYNIAIAFKLSGVLDFAGLNKSINTIIGRHEILRTSFTTVDRKPVQFINEYFPCDVSVNDLSALLPGEQQAETYRLATEDVRHPFNLNQPPLFRFRLLRLSEKEHLLLFTIHHIISDAWSLDIFFRELKDSYAQYQQSGDAALAELPIQYGDFSVWQRDGVESGNLEQQLVYWKEQLADVPNALDFPTDHRRPQQLSFRGSQERADFSKALLERLRSLAQEENVTLFMILLAAFNVLICRYTGEEDIVIGCPIAGRNQVETENLIGFFVNTLVLRTNLNGDPSFRELLQRTRAITLAAYANQDVPFEKLVQELQPARGLGHSPFFQLMLDFKSNADEDPEPAGWQVKNLDIDRGTARADLLLFLAEQKDSLSCLFEYSTDLFERPTIQRLLGHFEILLHSATEDADRRISDLPLLTGLERQQLLIDWNKIQRNTDGPTIHEWFERQVALTPGAIAVSFENDQITYAQLNQRANQLAHYLRARGVGPEVLVGICVQRSTAMLVGLIGILKAGGAYLPLDPSYPKERLAFMVTDAGLTRVIVQKDLLDNLPASGLEVVRIDADWDQISRSSTDNLERNTIGANAAYVIYTSGSTGKPKGVVVGHENVTRLFEATNSAYNFTGDDVWTLFHSYAFDFSVWEIWGALLYGGKLIVVPYWVSRSAESLYHLLIDQKVTVLNQTPSAFLQLIEVDEKTRAELSLRTVIFGGEALELHTLKPWFQRHGDERPQLVNMYGITETTVHVTYRRLRMTDFSASSVIGRPLPDLQVLLLDRNLQPVPIGVSGEIYVGGAGLARGYLKLPELTSERFIPSPFSAERGARLYKTGDVATFRLDGDLEYRGRVDNQVKIRGYRIELGEISANLAEHPSVRESVVVLGGSQSHPQLVAYVVPTPGSAPGSSELRELLRKRLPDYMLPTGFVFLEAIPLTPSGKVDQRALPAMDQVSVETAYVAPRTRAEEQLVDIWCEVLGTTRVGVNDNFFELGGHSLLATQVMTRIRDVFQIALPLRSMFARPTVAGLAEFLRNEKSGNQQMIPQIRRLPRGEVAAEREHEVGGLSNEQ